MQIFWAPEPPSTGVSVGPGPSVLRLKTKPASNDSKSDRSTSSRESSRNADLRRRLFSFKLSYRSVQVSTGSLQNDRSSDA